MVLSLYTAKYELERFEGEIFSWVLNMESCTNQEKISMNSFPAQIFQRLAPSLSTPPCINWPTPLISIPRRVFRLNANDKGNHHNAKQCERYKAISFVGKMAIYTAHRAEVRSVS